MLQGTSVMAASLEIDMFDLLETSSCCYSFLWSTEHRESKKAKPEDCSGVLSSAYEEGYGEGYYIQVCPRLSWLGRVAGGVTFCGNGPEVIILHRDTIPTEQEYEQVARDADDGDW